MKISKTGYKKNSKDKNQPSLLIPSNRITMKEDNGEPLKKGAILGTDNTGYSQMMYPGLDYSFPGDYVYEKPMKNWLSKYQVGGSPEPMSWTDYLKYMGADDAELKSINPRDYLLWEEDEHTLLKDLDPEKAKNARAAKINFYDKSARHTPHESDLLKDAYASRKADLIDTYNLLYFNNDKQDYSGSPGNVTKWENGKDVFYPGKFAIENEGDESLTAQEILDRAKTNYNLPIQDYASQRIKNRPNYADTKIPYTRVYPRTLLMDYNNPSADFNAGIEYMNDPRYTDVTENFYSDPPSARPMSFFPAPSYNYTNVPKRYDEKGNEVVSKYDIPNLASNTYYDFPGSNTEMIYNEKLRLNDITKENIRNIKTIDPSGNIGDIDYNTVAAKRYINDPWFYYGKERHDGDPYCVNCDKLSGSEHSQDNLFDYFKFKPQAPSSKMWWMKTFGLKPPRPIFLSQPNATSTGQVQIGWDIWDPKQQQWKAQNFSTDEINRRREEVKVPKDGGRDIEFKDSVIHDLAPYSLPPDIKPGTVVDTNNKPVIKEPKVVKAPTFKSGGWLEQYQGTDQSSQVKTYASDPNYFDNRAIYHDDSRFNDLIRSKVYAGTHGWDPTTNSLVKLDKPVAVPKAVQEMSTADYGKKTRKERFESNTPAGKEVRKAAVAQGMKDMVQNPLLYAPGAIAAGALAAPALAGVSGALSAPLTIGSTVIPGATMGNAIGALGAADALVNRFPEVPGQLSRGEYLDAAVNVGTGALDLYGANMVSPLYREVKAATKPIKNAYNTVATGESFLPVAWKSPAVGLTQSASDDMFRSLVNSGKLTPEERALVIEYQHSSREFTGRGLRKVDQEKRQLLNNIINKYKAEIGDDVVLTRMFSDRPDALGAELQNGRLNFGDRPTSFTAGVQPAGYAGSVNRVVIPRRYSKQMGDKFLVNQYDTPSEETMNALPENAKDFASWLGNNSRLLQERELIGTGLDFRQIGKVKNDIGGYDLVVKPNISKQLPGSPNKFKSQINWAKWNPETPRHPELIEEYNVIEESTKKAGTWMKNADGSPYQGSPEQFIQEQSSWFKKAYPEGYDETFRGVGPRNNDPDFSNSGLSEDLVGDRGIFTADRELASSYVPNVKINNKWADKKQILSPLSSKDEPGVFNLIHPKGKQIDFNVMNDFFNEVNLTKAGSSKESILEQLKYKKNHLDRLKKIDADPDIIQNQEKLLKKLEGYANDFENIKTDWNEFEKMKSILGEITSTDDIANYLPSTDLRKITLKNILDGGLGDVTIVNNRPGNYLKSRVGNVGFFNLNDPNIYKALVPAAIAGAGALQKEKDGGSTKQLSKYQSKNTSAITKGWHQKEYTDPEKFAKANKAFNDSLDLVNKSYDFLKKESPGHSYHSTVPYDDVHWTADGPGGHFIDTPFGSKRWFLGTTSGIDTMFRKPGTEFNKIFNESFTNKIKPIGFLTADYPFPIYKVPTEEPVYKEIKNLPYLDAKFELPELKLDIGKPSVKSQGIRIRPMMAADQNTTTGQYQSGKYIWDPQTKSWKVKMLSPEAQQENKQEVEMKSKKYGGWLDKYQGVNEPSQVERRDPNVPFFPSSMEQDLYESQYSQPEVTITPDWTEAELERNRLRDEYIRKDKNVFRHWYDKLGYDKDNVTKRANQFAYNKLAKQYLKGDKDKLTPEQRKFIEKSEYASRLQPSVGSRFAEGLRQSFDARVPNSGINLQTLANLAAPLEYPGNLIRGAVQGEFADALKGQTPSPYFVSSDLAGTSPREASALSTLMTVASDPLFLAGDEVLGGVGKGARGLRKFFRKSNNLPEVPQPGVLPTEPSRSIDEITANADAFDDFDDMSFDPSITDDISSVDPDLFKSLKDRLKGLERNIQNEELARDRELDKILDKEVPQEFMVDARAAGAKGPEQTGFFTEAEINEKLAQYDDYLQQRKYFDEMFPEDPQDIVMDMFSGTDRIKEREQMFENLFPNAKKPDWFGKEYRPEDRAFLANKLKFEPNSPFHKYRDKTSELGLKSLLDFEKKTNSQLPFQKYISQVEQEMSDPTSWYNTDPKGFVMEFRGQLDLDPKYIDSLSEQELRELAEDIQIARIRGWKESIMEQLNQKGPKPDITLPPERLNKYGGSIKWLDKYQDGGSRDMPLGLPLKEQNVYLLPEYNQPMANGYILPDPNRPQLLNTGATEYKYSYGMNDRDVQVPSVVAGQYIGDQAIDRYMISGEEFKPMLDPGAYSKYYNMLMELGLMQKKKGGEPYPSLGYYQYIGGYRGASA